ncbi:MAG: SCO family protein [Crocinitomicaceae bacterium]|jgi:protein SCO1/2|tara:strand:+ start:6713 stop:7372 length:660 start_codon:yes stop_codon:yes gene_type:complete
MKKILSLVLLMVVLVPIAYYFNKPSEEKKLDVLSPMDVNAEMVDSELRNIGRGHYIQDFEFFDQKNQRFQSSSIKDKIWVVEYFFATCKGICPIMNAQMQRVQSAHEKDTNVVILSFTVDPDQDTPEALGLYADEHGAIAGKWFFLTGEKSMLYELARKSFFLLKPAEAKNQGDAGGDFIHTNNFVLIDRDKQIRGYYDGTNPKEVDALILDVSRLKMD